MSEYKRVVRDKNGRITGVEVGEPHAPSAADFRNAYQDLINAERDFERVTSGNTQPGIEASRKGIAGAAEAIIERWHGVPDDARCSLVRNFQESTRDTKQSTKKLEAAMEAHEQGGGVG